MAVSHGRGTGHASMRSCTGQAHRGTRTQDKSYEGQSLPDRQFIAGSLRLRPLSILKPRTKDLPIHYQRLLSLKHTPLSSVLTLMLATMSTRS